MAATSMITATDQDQATAPPADQPSRAGLLASLPGFRQPRPPMPSMTASPDQPLPGGEPGAAAAAEDGGRGSREQTTSIPAFFKQRSKSYAKIAGTLLESAGGWLNKISDEDSEAFLPDEDDLEMIPPPLGRLAARRLKLGADPEQLSDIEDIGIAAVGVAVWLVKGVNTLWAARRERRKLEQGAAVHRETGDGQS